MPSEIAANFGVVQQKVTYLSDKSIGSLCKLIAISGLVLHVFTIIFSNHPYCRSSALFSNLRHQSVPSPIEDSPTNISHIVFGTAGLTNSWKYKRPYIAAWWRPNITRGFIFLDRAPNEYIPWPLTSHPFQISEDTSRNNEYNKHAFRHAIRLVRIVLEALTEENKGVRWYVMGDDDTIFFVDNLVEVFAKYDHTKYFYVGANSECVASNFDHSFGVAFGGPGYVLSYPLAEAVAKNLDVCIKTCPTLYGSDHLLQSCVADLGVSLTQEKGFHQIDLHSDISGFLSAHPQSPLVSLHHLDMVDPFFPYMNHYESLNHPMKAAKVDQSGLLQQTTCYDKQRIWSFSISWGYSINIYEKFYPPSILHRPLKTITPWKKTARPPYMFNTRILSKDSCEAPHNFYFDSIEETMGDHIVISYIRRSSPRLPACLSSSNHSADFIYKIQVLSSAAKRHTGAGTRRECCDLSHVGETIAKIKIRACMKDEVVACM